MRWTQRDISRGTQKYFVFHATVVFTLPQVSGYLRDSCSELYSNATKSFYWLFLAKLQEE